jgi:uncharacterized membrane protein SpoIIM required for sporulation
VLDRLASPAAGRLTLDEVRRLHYLYERCSSDLARMTGCSMETASRRYLEALVARAYAEVHGTAARRRPAVWQWLASTLPQTFRKHAAAFWVAAAITVAGALLGVALLLADAGAKRVLMPFAALMEDPAKRVAQEESQQAGRLEGVKARFSAMLMTHNVRVTLTTLAMGMTWGIGSIVLLFYNGVILGAVAGDYVRAGQSTFLLGWLLPHGSVEIPAILLGGQAGLVLASALIGWGDSTRRGERMRAAAPDVLTIAGGAALLLVWAGIVEAFISQYHAPVLPYSLKIGFGVLELAALAVYLARAGRT